MISLLVISSSTKSGDETNLTAKVNNHLIENDEEHQDDEEIEPLQKTDGEQVTQEELHAFPISTATINF